VLLTVAVCVLLVNARRGFGLSRGAGPAIPANR
jgi:hypothetical protein